jgi:hypothetical protein
MTFEMRHLEIVPDPAPDRASERFVAGNRPQSEKHLGI